MSATDIDTSRDVTTAVRATLDLPAGRNAIEYEGRWIDWGEVRALVGGIDDAIAASGVGPLHGAAFIARNRASHAAILGGLVAAGRPISMVYAFQSAVALAAEIERLRPAILIASADDWSPELRAVAERVGITRISVSMAPPYTVTATHPAGPRRDDHHVLPEPGIEILSSGTTGPPKRIFHRSRMLFRSLMSGGAEPDPDVAIPPDLVFWPMSGIGGVLQVMRGLIAGGSLVVLERFTAAGAVDAIKRHRIRSIALTPTMARMIYDADVPASDLANLVAIYGGAGPLDLDLQDKLEARYGLPVIWAMGATEFCGAVVSWTPELKRKFGTTKRGSTGVAMSGVELAVRDPETHAELPPGEIGIFTVRVALQGPEWIETTDLVAIDEDGFVFHHGRSDGAIIRGGFKVIPEKVNEMLRLHPGVAEAAVIGAPEPRLGAVPVAAVVRRRGHETLNAETLETHLRDLLPAPQIPVRFHFVEEMPYTASTKVDLRALRTLIGEA